MKSARPAADTSEVPRQGQRLPPGQVLTDKWPVLHYGSVPKTDLSTWSFRVFGLVEREKRWTWEEFLSLPRLEVRSDIHCVTRWSRFDNRWQGVAVKHVLGEAGVRPEARFAIAHAEQGFTANLPLSELLRDDVLLALKHDGEDLTPEHGWPLRLVAPSRYFWKSAKWIRALEITAQDRPGFWEQNGYHNEADPWMEQRFSDW
jgi:DMSO/TMAO reductase YedYZ molybdopterin-dependent catalytic subunit